MPPSTTVTGRRLTGDLDQDVSITLDARGRFKDEHNRALHPYLLAGTHLYLDVAPPAEGRFLCAHLPPPACVPLYASPTPVLVGLAQEDPEEDVFELAPGAPSCHTLLRDAPARDPVMPPASLVVRVVRRDVNRICGIETGGASTSMVDDDDEDDEDEDEDVLLPLSGGGRGVDDDDDDDDEEDEVDLPDDDDYDTDGAEGEEGSGEEEGGGEEEEEGVTGLADAAARVVGDSDDDDDDDDDDDME